jgi:hypothetical protein
MSTVSKNVQFVRPEVPSPGHVQISGLAWTDISGHIQYVRCPDGRTDIYQQGPDFPVLKIAKTVL